MDQDRPELYTPPANGSRTFFTIWSGQLISLLGSQLTGFALGVWVYSQTRSVMMLALVQVAQQAPYILLSPLAGVLSDRWNRRTAMIVSDFGAGLAVLMVAVLALTNHLQAWMVIPINLWMASFNTLMWPALTSAVTLLVPKKQFGRANGFVQLGEAVPQIAGPALAGVMYVVIHIGNMALIDFATYAFAALLMLFMVRIPSPPRSQDGQAAKGSVWKEMRFGWDYIIARKGLLGLLSFFLLFNFVSGVMSPLIVPLILDNWDASTLGFLSTLMGVGMLGGTLVMSAWGGGKRKVVPLLVAGMMVGLFTSAAGLRASLPLIAVCGVGIMFFDPFMNACSQAIWQAKVAPDVQGRVFAVRRTIAWSAGLIAPLLAAPLADKVFKPAMAEGGSMAAVLGPIFGVGAGRGVGVLITLVGLLSLIVAVVSLFNPIIRNVERDLPDFEADKSEVPSQ
jgi:MFS transporter, DHA3 family, macrolide efflux protein